MTVGGDALLDKGFSATGVSANGAVRLVGAKSDGQFSLNGAVLTNQSGSALMADRMTVGGGASLGAKFMAIDAGTEGAVRLRDVKVVGPLSVRAATVRSAIDGERRVVDGLVFDGYPTCGLDEWLDLLRYGSVSYTAQPYRQLAATARDIGHDAEARRSLIAQRDDYAARGGLTFWPKAWIGFTKIMLGYGYRPSRALVWLGVHLAVAILLTLLVPGALALSAGEAGAVAAGSKVQAVGVPCTYVQAVQIAIDMTVPLVSTSRGTTCEITSTLAGQALSWFGTYFTVAGWALSALFAAGFTRAIRQP